MKVALRETGSNSYLIHFLTVILNGKSMHRTRKIKLNKIAKINTTKKACKFWLTNDFNYFDR